MWKTIESESSKVPEMKMRKPSWFLPLKIKLYHLTKARQKIEMHSSIREEYKKRRVRWIGEAGEREVYNPVQELSAPVIGKIYRLITSNASEATEIFKLALLENGISFR